MMCGTRHKNEWTDKWIDGQRDSKRQKENVLCQIPLQSGKKEPHGELGRGRWLGILLPADFVKITARDERAEL